MDFSPFKDMNQDQYYCRSHRNSNALLRVKGPYEFRERHVKIALSLGLSKTAISKGRLVDLIMGGRCSG
jgi:hypothetical protein